MNSSINITETQLSFWTCYFLSNPNGTYTSLDPNVVYKCRRTVVYLAGSSPTAQHTGRIVCFVIYGLIYLFGIFGFVTNVLNLCILRKSLSGVASLKRLLLVLAAVELVACCAVIANVALTNVIQENWSRSLGTLQTFAITNAIYSLGRTVSIYITVLVTIERYLVVAFPIESRSWLAPSKSRWYLAAAILLSILLNLNWFLNTQIVKNDSTLLPKNSELATFPYTFNYTSFQAVWTTTVRYPFVILNYVAPLPLLLLFNGLLYKSIHNWNTNRTKLSGRQKREIGAAKMFSVVALILLCCHSIAVALFFISEYLKIVHHEMYIMILFSVTVSSSINFVVYFSYGRAFRMEFRRLVGPCLSGLGWRQKSQDNAQGPASSHAESSSVMAMGDVGNDKNS